MLSHTRHRWRNVSKCKQFRCELLYWINTLYWQLVFDCRNQKIKSRHTLMAIECEKANCFNWSCSFGVRFQKWMCHFATCLLVYYFFFLRRSLYLPWYRLLVTYRINVDDDLFAGNYCRLPLNFSQKSFHSFHLYRSSTCLVRSFLFSFSSIWLHRYFSISYDLLLCLPHTIHFPSLFYNLRVIILSRFREGKNRIFRQN